MFDNEIDWVMRILSVSPYQADRKVCLKGCDFEMTQYKAEHIVGSRSFLSCAANASVQKYEECL